MFSICMDRKIRFFFCFKKHTSGQLDRVSWYRNKTTSVTWLFFLCDLRETWPLRPLPAHWQLRACRFGPGKFDRPCGARITVDGGKKVERTPRRSSIFTASLGVGKKEKKKKTVHGYGSTCVHIRVLYTRTYMTVYFFISAGFIGPFIYDGDVNMLSRYCIRATSPPPPPVYRRTAGDRGHRCFFRESLRFLAADIR